MRCKRCQKTHQNSWKSFTWINEQLCPKCYAEEHELERVKIFKEEGTFEFIYVRSYKKFSRVCKFCRHVEKDGKVEMCRSVVTGDWVCMKCFNEKIRNG